VRYSIRVGSWELRGPDGEQRHVRRPLARLLAFLALRGGVQQRSLVAGSLWPDGCERRACSNLRSTLWHARIEVEGIVGGDASTIWLLPDVDVDLDHAMQVIRSLLLGDPTEPAQLHLLLDDVLPEWDEEWVHLLRFLHRQLRLQALERAVTRHVSVGHWDEAVQLARQVAEREPDRVSTQVLLDECEHLGDVCSALRLGSR
jgi:DNA-binding SARP family transcriptional activator